MMDYDLIVVGGGGAGMAAAIEARSAGARVLIVEAGARLGGSTRLSGGVYYGAGTSVQRAAGVQDSAEAMYHYYMVLNQYRADPALVRRLSDLSAETLDWLIEMGAEFLPENLYVSGVDRVRRGHRATGQGAGIADALEARVSALGVDVALRTRVQQLLRDPSGAVCGITVEGDSITAPTVVLATGGFGANAEKLADYYPDAAAAADWAWYIGVETCRGDAIDMALPLGAEVVGHNKGLLLLTPNFGRDVAPYLPPWLAFVNREGRRFIDETTEYSVVSGVLRAQLGGECFAILDEQARLASKGVGVTAKNPWAHPGWDADSLGTRAARGDIFTAPDLYTLGERAGIRPQALVQTMADYNADVALGQDRQFFKPAAYLRGVEQPPFYAVRLRAAVVCLTSAGVRINDRAQVLDRAGRPVRGLYAAGEAAGGVMGERYVGGGNSITNAILYGRIAGRRE